MLCGVSRELLLDDTHAIGERSRRQGIAEIQAVLAEVDHGPQRERWKRRRCDGRTERRLRDMIAKLAGRALEIGDARPLSHVSPTRQPAKAPGA